MIKISKTGRMSVVCDKCGKQHPSARGLSLIAVFDDKEYICSKCKRLLTPLAPDVGDSVLEDSPFETGIRRGAVVIPPAAGKA